MLFIDCETPYSHKMLTRPSINNKKIYILMYLPMLHDNLQSYVRMSLCKCIKEHLTSLYCIHVFLSVLRSWQMHKLWNVSIKQRQCASDSMSEIDSAVSIWSLRQHFFFLQQRTNGEWFGVGLFKRIRIDKQWEYPRLWYLYFNCTDVCHRTNNETTCIKE